jgi:hypothetical protein
VRPVQVGAARGGGGRRLDAPPGPPPGAVAGIMITPPRPLLSEWQRVLHAGGPDLPVDVVSSSTLIALASFKLMWHGVVSKACEKVPALAQLKKWSLGDPLQISYELMSKLTAELATSLQHIVVVFRDVCGWLCCIISNYSSVAKFK